MTAPLDERAVALAHEAYHRTLGGTLDGQPMHNAIRAYLAASPSPSMEMEVVATELKMTPISDGMPTRDEFRGEQTILTYCEQVGTWDIAFMEAGWDDFDSGFALGGSHWLDITSMWPGVIAQVAQFAKEDSAQVLRLIEENEVLSKALKGDAL